LVQLARAFAGSQSNTNYVYTDEALVSIRNPLRYRASNRVATEPRPKLVLASIPPAPTRPNFGCGHGVARCDRHP